MLHQQCPCVCSALRAAAINNIFRRHGCAKEWRCYMQIHIFIYTHQLHNLHARLYIALYQFHPPAACSTSLDLITC